MRLAYTITSHPCPVPALTITDLDIDQALLLRHAQRDSAPICSRDISPEAAAGRR